MFCQNYSENCELPIWPLHQLAANTEVQVATIQAPTPEYLLSLQRKELILKYVIIINLTAHAGVCWDQA